MPCSVKGCSNCTTARKMGSMWAMGAAHSAAGIVGQVEPSCFNKSVMLVGFSCQSLEENRMKSHQSVMLNYLNGALDIIFLQFGTPSACGSAVRMGHLSYRNPLFLQHIPVLFPTHFSSQATLRIGLSEAPLPVGKFV